MILHGVLSSQNGEFFSRRFIALTVLKQVIARSKRGFISCGRFSGEKSFKVVKRVFRRGREKRRFTGYGMGGGGGEGIIRNHRINLKPFHARVRSTF